MRKLITIVLGFTCLITHAQLAWPTVNNTMKPWTRWWWQGSAVTESDLSYTLSLYKEAGLGGVEITPIYGVYGQEQAFINYLSPEWMSRLDYTLKEAKKRTLGVDLANGTGWPFGGPWVKEEDASKTVYHIIYKVAAGKKIAQKIQYQREAYIRTANNKILKPSDLIKPLAANKNHQALSLDQVHYPSTLPLLNLTAYSKGKAPLDLTSKVSAAGQLNWVAPTGDWTLVALFTALHGKLVERAAPGGEGYAIDHFAKQASSKYFQRFDSAFEKHDLSSLRSFFNDSYEVDDAKGQANWTNNLLSTFTKKRGYPLTHHLPALFASDSTEKNGRILYDYRSTIDELLLENFTVPWKQWASSKKKLVRNQSHGSPANTLDLYAAVDIPETEGNDILRFKFASSAGNVGGKNLVSAEAATWLDEHFLSDWADVKKAINLFFLGGVNHIFYHGTAYSPKAAPWPGWLFYAAVHFQPTNPMWKHFHELNSYVTRVQSFLQTSKPDNDLLVYYPIADVYSKAELPLLQHFDGMEKNFENSRFKQISEWMIENDYTFDFFSGRQLNDFKYNSGIETHGNTYQAILLPGNSYITTGEFLKLIALAKQGATVLIDKNIPAKVPGYANHKMRQRLLDSLVSTLVFKNEGTVKTAVIGKGKFMIGDDIGSLLIHAQIRKEILHTNGISFLRKTNASGTIYLLSNTSGSAFNDWVNFQANAKGTAAAFDPVTGASGLLESKKGDAGQPLHFIKLEPGETIICQLFTAPRKGSRFPYFEKAGAAIPLNGQWKIEFMEGGPNLPAPQQSTGPQFWTTNNDSSAKNFSGTAKYSTTFSRPVEASRYWQLNLGEVNATAEIWLNGTKITTVIGPTYTVMIPAEKLLAENKLEVVVANLMANRIAHMDRNHIPWKIFYNTNMPARKKENSKQGLFDASEWKPLPSGLAGPVTLTPLKTKDNF
jgi:hypothetical protein